MRRGRCSSRRGSSRRRSIPYHREGQRGCGHRGTYASKLRNIGVAAQAMPAQFFFDERVHEELVDHRQPTGEPARVSVEASNLPLRVGCDGWKAQKVANRMAQCAGTVRDSVPHGPAQSCRVPQRTPHKYQSKQQRSFCFSIYEPGGRGFESCRARQSSERVRPPGLTLFSWLCDAGGPEGSGAIVVHEKSVADAAPSMGDPPVTTYATRRRMPTGTGARWCSR